MTYRIISEQEAEHARHDRDRGRYGKTVAGGTGKPCPAWCKGPGRPEQACDRCRQVADSRSKTGTPTLWGKPAKAKPKPTYEEERGLTPRPSEESQSKQSEAWDARVARERAEVDLWADLQEKLGGQG